jgi:prevent-host-death family protein
LDDQTMSNVGSFEAKTKFAELLARVEAGESFTITRHGAPVARLVPVDSVGERDRQRALVEEIKRWRVGKDRGAKAGTRIADLVKAGRRY